MALIHHDHDRDNNNNGAESNENQPLEHNILTLYFNIKLGLVVKYSNAIFNNFRETYFQYLLYS